MALVSVGAGPVRLETARTEGICDGKPHQYYTNFLNLIPMGSAIVIPKRFLSNRQILDFPSFLKWDAMLCTSGSWNITFHASRFPVFSFSASVYIA